jgi:hypothetical protein
MAPHPGRLAVWWCPREGTGACRHLDEWLNDRGSPAGAGAVLLKASLTGRSQAACPVVEKPSAGRTVAGCPEPQSRRDIGFP